MADKSKIEWTDATWNPVRGCSVVSEGCRNCYAMTVAARFNGKDQAYEGLAYRNESGAHWTGKVRLIEEHLEDPLRWKRPRRIFVNSMSDLFHESVPDEWLAKIFHVMARAGHHTFQVLSKRDMSQRVNEALKQEVEILCAMDSLGAGIHQEIRWPLPNVQLIASVEDQPSADQRISWLLKTIAAVRGISAEPLLGPIDLSIGNMIGGAECYCGDFVVGDHGPYGKDACRVCRCKGVRDPWSRNANRRIDWVIAGGESGPGARPMHPDWARLLRDQCVAAGVPFFFKQWGEWLSVTRDSKSRIRLSADPQWHIWPDEGQESTVSKRIGKLKAGRLLDAREWNEYPLSTQHSALSTTGASA